MRDCEDKNLGELQNMSLEDKITMSKKRIIEFYSHVDGKVYVSFSGGKDSTVLLHLVRSVYPGVIGVFCDTGLEFPEIKDFVRSQENIITIRPKIGFKQVIEKYGYPIVSKEQSQYIGFIKNCKDLSKPTAQKRLNGKELGYKFGYISDKWKYLLDAPFKISDKCCDVMKKKPFLEYEKASGLFPVIGTMAEESRLRRLQWEKSGCNVFEGKRLSSRPISFWTEKDVYDYLKKFSLEISEIYHRGAQRTGCIFCLYGFHKDVSGEDKFSLLLKTHPKLLDYCLREDGLNMKQVLEWYPVNKKETK